VNDSALTVDRLQRPAELTDQQWGLVVLGLAEQLVALMVGLHERGIVHGNLGPSTVLLEQGTDEELRVRLGSAPERLYAAPEIEHGRAPDLHSDVYGFGCVLAALLLSVPEPSWDQILHPSERMDVADALRQLAAEAMSERPAARPYSFRVLRERLVTVRNAWDADQLAPGAGAELLDAGRVPDELAAILGWISARLPAPLAGWIPGWGALVARLGLPTRVSGSRRGLRGGVPVQSRSRSVSLIAPRRGRLVPTLAGVAAVLAVGMIVIWGAASARGPQPAEAAVRTAVPVVAGRSVAEATAVLQRAGLSVAGQRGQHDDSAPVGKVLATDPTAGTSVTEQTRVILVVSAGPDTVVMPDVEGLSLGAATQALGSAGLVVGAVAHSDGPKAKDTVLSASLTAGSDAVRGASVDLTVASGSQEVPGELVGRDAGAAAAVLTAAGFQPRTVSVDTADFVTGYVMQTSPAAGQSAELGSTVTLTVANYVPPAAPTATSTPSETPSETPSRSSPPSSTPTPPPTPSPTKTRNPKTP
jgi:eukaryotic-like serine/threonine-protein kinase